MTRGDQGMWLLATDAEGQLAASAREVADVTGAGDTVIADDGARAGVRSDHARSRAPGQPGGRRRGRQSSAPRPSRRRNCFARCRCTPNTDPSWPCAQRDAPSLSPSTAWRPPLRCWRSPLPRPAASSFTAARRARVVHTRRSAHFNGSCSRSSVDSIVDARIGPFGRWTLQWQRLPRFHRQRTVPCRGLTVFVAARRAGGAGHRGGASGAAYDQLRDLTWCRTSEIRCFQSGGLDGSRIRS